MATKQRLIDAKAFDLRVSQKKMTEVFPNWKELPVEVQDAVCKHAQHLHMLLETQHTVDAVEVVRCRNCRAFEAGVEYYGGGTKDLCRLFKRQVTEDSFCSWGERMTDHGK